MNPVKTLALFPLSKISNDSIAQFRNAGIGNEYNIIKSKYDGNEGIIKLITKKMEDAKKIPEHLAQR